VRKIERCSKEVGNSTGPCMELVMVNSSLVRVFENPTRSPAASRKVSYFNCWSFILLTTWIELCRSFRESEVRVSGILSKNCFPLAKIDEVEITRSVNDFGQRITSSNRLPLRTLGGITIEVRFANGSRWRR
jgi:hypothetical protein